MADFSLFARLGWEHIWEGYDHLLFLLALVLRIQDWKKLVAVVSAFTLTHTIAMIFVALGWVSVSSHVVESAIAFSIFFSAVQNVISDETRYKWIIAGGFGFIHGAGFSSHLIAMLSDMQTFEELFPSVLGFLAGLEAGQLIFVSAVTLSLLTMKYWSLLEPLKVEISRAVAAVGLYMFVIRALGE